MTYTTVSVDIDVDLDMLLDALSDSQFRDLIADGFANGYGPEGWHFDEDCIHATVSDPVSRLELINELRREGYILEPGGSNESTV